MDASGSGHRFFGHEPILVSATQDEGEREQASHPANASPATTLAIVPLAESQALPRSATGYAERPRPYSASQSPAIANLFSALHDLQASMFTMQASHRSMHASINDLQHNMEDMQRHLSILDRLVTQTQTRELADELYNNMSGSRILLQACAS